MSSLRHSLLEKLALSRTIIERLRQQGEVARHAVEWEKDYAKALEDLLGLEGVSQRRSPRRAVAIATEITRPPRQANAAPGQATGTITDLSPEGCGLATTMELSVGEGVTLSFTLPDSEHPLTLDGWIRRAQRIGEVLAVGVEFQEPPEESQKAIQNFLASWPLGDDLL